jgi:hypothetical protein
VDERYFPGRRGRYPTAIVWPMKALLLVLLGLVGFALVIWGAVRGYRRAPRIEDNHNGTATGHNLDGGDRTALSLQIAGAVLALIAVVLSVF